MADQQAVPPSGTPQASVETAHNFTTNTSTVGHKRRRDDSPDSTQDMSMIRKQRKVELYPASNALKSPVKSSASEQGPQGEELSELASAIDTDNVEASSRICSIATSVTLSAGDTSQANDDDLVSTTVGAQLKEDGQWLREQLTAWGLSPNADVWVKLLLGVPYYRGDIDLDSIAKPMPPSTTGSVIASSASMETSDLLNMQRQVLFELELAAWERVKADSIDALRALRGVLEDLTDNNLRRVEAEPGSQRELNPKALFDDVPRILARSLKYWI